MIKDISTLPDYAALKKLASALWQQDSSYHGAAVMVGAGFSRSAASTGDTTKKLPIWNDFSKVLATELSSSSTDPLRLAEEYCAYFGKQALHDLINKQLNDAAWTPGELHKSLLELPWSEILTTNWDTLLERASTEVFHPIYSVASKQEDLSSARSPRIVKLHGTIGKTKDLVFTQEDYRKYPQQHAAFVNFSRQVFIENELCLLGFSGDDPNFLQWAGWVRDHLTTHSRRIYLVGALGLNAAKRKYLESINVAPIDLNDLVTEYDEQDIRHLEATKVFIQVLQELEPKKAWEWSPAQLRRTTMTGKEITKTHQDGKYGALLLEEQIPSLEKDRTSYPEWLICPNLQRFQLQNQISDPWPNATNLSAMTSTNKAKLLYEISWRHQVTFESIPSWLANEFLGVCNPDTSCAISKKQQLEIALFLLKNTRWMEAPESENIAIATNAILEKGEKYWPECRDELYYHNAVVARDHFDYVALEQYAEKIKSSSPVWRLKRASLLAELGRFDQGKVLVAQAHKELLIQYRNDRNSVYVLSRLAWAHWLMRAVDLSSFSSQPAPLPTHYKDAKCDPWDLIDHMRNQISKALDRQQKQQSIEPLFEPGRYRDNSNALSFSNELHPLLLLEGISRTAGIPLIWDNVNLLVDQAARLTELKEVDSVHRFALAIRAANSDSSDVLKKVFSTIEIARLSENDVNFLLDRCTQATNYWITKCSEKSGSHARFAIERLRVFIEVLARVSVRATAEQAIQIFRLGVSIGQKTELQHFLLFDAIKHLLEFSLKSIPQSQQPDVLLDALSFPLQSELSVKDHNRWANPVVDYPGERKQDSAVDRRIDEIIDRIAPCSTQSAPALLRLLPLIKKEFLRDIELNKISEKIWGSGLSLNAIPETGLLEHVLLAFPSPNPSAVKALVRRHLFEAKGPSLLNQDLLTDIANAAQAEGIKELPSAEEAADYFDQLVAWRPKKDDNDMTGFLQNKENQTAKLVGEVLARSVVPALSPEVLTEDFFRKLCDFYNQVDTPVVLVAFPFFAVANETLIEPVEKLIRLGLQSDDANKVAYASYSLLKLRDHKKLPAIDRLIVRLIYLIGSTRMTGLSALLWTANQMYCKKYLPDESIGSLVENLPLIFDNSDYRITPPSGRESVSVSFVRAACAKLAWDIVRTSEKKNEELLRILEAARHDALPEVRFVLADN